MSKWPVVKLVRPVEAPEAPPWMPHPAEKLDASYETETYLPESSLLGEAARARAGRAAYEDFDPDGSWETLDEALRMTWEGNTAAGIEAAIQAAKESR